MPKLIDLTGQRIGRLFVVQRCGSQNGHATWLCRCDCGNEKIISVSSLKQGTQSCGCLWVEAINNWNQSEEKKKVTASLKTTHGGRGSRLYRIWRAMKTRCRNSNVPCFRYYGGRGIRVCDEWEGSFQSFAEWAIQNGYDDNLTIDRIDNDGNYEPSNCRWVTMTEQNKNKRKRS